jgi:hypothetical protein
MDISDHKGEDVVRCLCGVYEDSGMMIQVWSSELYVYIWSRARNNGRSTDNVRPECGVVWSNSYLAAHFDLSLSVKEQTNIFILINNQNKVVKYYNNMLSNILREKNFNVRQLSHTVCHKAHGHAFGLRVN